MPGFLLLFSETPFPIFIVFVFLVLVVVSWKILQRKEKIIVISNPDFKSRDELSPQLFHFFNYGDTSSLTFTRYDNDEN